MSLYDEQVRRFNDALEREKERSGETARQIAARVGDGVAYSNFRSWSRRPVPPRHREAVATTLAVGVDWLRAADYIAEGRDAIPGPGFATAIREELASRVGELAGLVLKIAEDQPLTEAELAALRRQMRSPERPGEDNPPGQVA